jgi:hypothetical protein
MRNIWNKISYNRRVCKLLRIFYAVCVYQMPDEVQERARLKEQNDKLTDALRKLRDMQVTIGWFFFSPVINVFVTSYSCVEFGLCALAFSTTLPHTITLLPTLPLSTRLSLLFPPTSIPTHTHILIITPRTITPFTLYTRKPIIAHRQVAESARAEARFAALRRECDALLPLRERNAELALLGPQLRYVCMSGIVKSMYLFRRNELEQSRIGDYLLLFVMRNCENSHC